MSRWLTLAEAQARDLSRRRLALVLLFALPASWYLAELAAGRAWAIGAGALAMAWTAGAASLFAVLGARAVDPRLIQAGYRPLDLVVGRLAVLFALALAVSGAFALLILVGSRPSRLGDLFLGLTLGSLVAVALGWTLAVLIPHELEAVLVLIGIAGISPTAPSPLDTWLPYYAVLRFTDVERPPPAALPLTVHALAYTFVLLSLAILIWSRRSPGRPEISTKPIH